MIRRFDDLVGELMATAEIVGGTHLSHGQEATVVGACMALRPDDYMVGNHRSHGHPIGKGADLGPLMAELLGRGTGINKGKGGSMHLADFKVGSLGETSIVGSGLPTAVGGALSARLLGNDRVALVFFGDGGAQEGTFHEAVNLAAIWKLPVIFYCENNQYASSTPFSESNSVPNVADRAAGYGIPGEIVDGQDVLECWAAVDRAVRRGRDGHGPSLIEAKTYRFSSHSWGARDLRSADEVETWRRDRDPITFFRARLIADRVASEEQLAACDLEVEAKVADAVRFARESEFPDPREAFTDVFAAGPPSVRGA
jgi:TPP-dependent pyruvate/acetoin dehydrogenase alpha subunit